MALAILDNPADSVSGILDESTIMISGFGEAGSPVELIHLLVDHGGSNNHRPGKPDRLYWGNRSGAYCNPRNIR